MAELLRSLYTTILLFNRMSDLTILIVDDDPDLCHLLGGILRMRTFKVGVAPDLKTATDCIQQIKPSLIFLDHNLPDGTGIDFISHINSFDKNIKIVVMTADSTPGIDTRAMANGADHFLVKPFTHAIVNGVVDEVLSNRRKVE